MNLYVLFILLSCVYFLCYLEISFAPLSMLVSRMKAVQLGKQNAKIKLEETR